MRLTLFTATTLLTVFSTWTAAIAENLSHVQQLISTRQCPSCELSSAGLVHANLVGANLQGADLSQANLSQANLTNADLRGANLSGAMLQGANLSGADLRGANLLGADLRSAYLYGANIEGTDLQSTYLQDAIGLPEGALSFEDYYRWGIERGTEGNYARAVEYFSQAIQHKPDFAPAYLARAIARYKLVDPQGAISDSTQAADLFAAQGNPEGETTARRFIEEVEAIEEAVAKGPQAEGSLDNLVRGVAGMLLQFFF